MTPKRSSLRKSGLAAALAIGGVVGVGVNLLVLASPLYMLQVFDRVLSSRSHETLLYLTLITILALAALGILDACRAAIFNRLGDWLDRVLSPRVVEVCVELALRPGTTPNARPLQDLATVRTFLSSNAVNTLLDAPWSLAFTVIIFFMHPLLGAVALGGAGLLFAIAIATDRLTHKPTEAANQKAQALAEFVAALSRNAEAARAMAMTVGARRIWTERKTDQADQFRIATLRIGALLALSKALRILLQVLILGAGALLVIERTITPGTMVAASILLSRALAPVEQAIGSWRSLVLTRNAWRRLRTVLDGDGERSAGLALPRPEGALRAEALVLDLSGPAPPILRGVSYALEPGQTLGILGPSGSGKSCLARLLVGAWRPTSGAVRLDGADLRQWDPDALGRHIGYLPQTVELFAGTVMENIARWEDAGIDDVIAAARLADAHDMILGLAEGYKTQIGLGGAALSGGQRQRVALARALFGEPRLVVLDEPNANLDQVGEKALLHALENLRSRRITTALVSHRRPVLAVCDRALWLQNGAALAFGPPDEVVAKIDRLRETSLIRGAQRL